MTIGENIKRLRLKAGLTQQELADKLGVSNVNISLIESDQRGLSVKKADLLASILGVTINDLVANNISIQEELDRR